MKILLLLIYFIGLVYCKNVKDLLNQYSEFKLEANIDHLNEDDKKMLNYLFKVSDIMDDIFWLESIGEKSDFLKSIKSKDEKEYAKINYGPWDKFTEKPFINGYGKKPKGAKFYPDDITEKEFDQLKNKEKDSWYTLLKRNKHGQLYTKWYHEEFADQIKKAASLLESASKYSTNQSFKNYLKLRAKALRTDEYYESDIAWMDLTNNTIDFIVGPIESYADGFKGIKAAHSAQILIKDLDWSKRIEKYNGMLPQLQENLPVSSLYKQDQTSKGDMYVYYLVYCRGDYNWGSKNIAINLPNDPNVQKVKGTRKLQLKNAMQAKYERILIPMANILVDESQLKHVVFDDGFFQNTMFHEVAHGFGVKFVVTNSSISVRKALEETYSSLEEAKADITGIFFIQYLVNKGELKLDIMDCYTSYLAGVLRSIRFGESTAHGLANMISYNFITEMGGFNKTELGKYRVDKDKMEKAVSELVKRIITIQGDGNKKVAQKFIEKYGYIKDELKEHLDTISKAGIPKDIVFDQDKKNIGI
ncbi:hypothetical protein DICPUDRAFT_73875 [Dictyostelium purpureum]|uniref:Peptidase M49 family protein n=1 Tax=Dictyostelium purpureum TaxID=5786 RepID=F0Z645_DICPU|nr:uncharacterized protein DICPUDRAFT_73875 [Dictyostelium purpureum]EGC40537.1 hypothetical protein DICPUDRAFT_73875 [Dictyostelium purpureum]|eukprot:XP_003282873.1 hypothetical protein DICPUDRAFT_73875 [Dictyostelium purpureum]